MDKDIALASSTELGNLGIPHLKRMWSSALAARNGIKTKRVDEKRFDKTVLNALGLGLHQTMQYLFQVAPTFAEFEGWVIATAGEPDVLVIKRLRTIFLAQPQAIEVKEWLRTIDDMPAVLSDDDLSFWKEQGYVVLKNAVSLENSQQAEEAIWQYVGAVPTLRDSWYQASNSGIMVELIQHFALEVNRRSQRIHKAFAQLWESSDLWVSADRCGFHPPQQDAFPFPGPDMHWDIDFNGRFEFGTQGILYLTDTPTEQGAFTLVPGFHKRFHHWLTTLPEGSDPQQQDLHALGSQPIAGEAGDLVIWNQLLPHGSSPNLGQQPRIVQYINMSPCSALAGN